MLILAFALPAAIIVAAVAAFTARAIERRRNRAMDIAYAQHRQLILALRAYSREWDEWYRRRQEREAMRAYIDNMLGAARAIADAFTGAFRTIEQGVRPAFEAFAEATTHTSSAPRDPRVHVVPERRR